MVGGWGGGSTWWVDGVGVVHGGDIFGCLYDHAGTHLWWYNCVSYNTCI